MMREGSTAMNARRITEMHPTNVMALPRPSTDDLDLTTLPPRLDGPMLSRVWAIANAPLTAPQPCDERHLQQCLRVMLAVLPKRHSDDVSGELFIAAYLRQLRQFPNEAISFLADRATASCQWFPTISECLTMIGEWRRRDAATERRALARGIARTEENTRQAEAARPVDPLPPITQSDVDGMNESLINIGINCGALIRNADGTVSPAP